MSPKYSSPSQNDVMEVIQQSRQKKLLCNCANLVIGYYPDYYKNKLYCITCTKDSFEYPGERFAEDTVFPKCPDNCRLFLDKELVKTAQERQKFWKHIKSCLGFFYNLIAGFFKLAWQTQVIIIIFFILFFTPRWVPWIISLYKAIRTP